GDRLRRPGSRAIDLASDRAARLPDRAGRRLHPGDDHRDRELRGGHPLRLPESHHQAALMAVTLPREALAYETRVGSPTGSRAWRRFAFNPAAIAGSLILAVVIAAALAAPWVAPHDPAKQSLLRRFTPPVWQAGGNAAYPLGTDQVGRDVLSRIVHGARISLLVGVSAVIVSLLVGVTAGLVSGFVGGKVDTAIGTGVDVTLSFPQILLALAFVAGLGPSLVPRLVVLGLTGWERYTRVVRAEGMALREKEFIEAARSIGVGRLRIIFRN